MYRGKLVVPANLVGKILYEYHDARGHFGQTRTQDMIATHFYWPHMTHHVRDYCRKCESCSRNKPDT